MATDVGGTRPLTQFVAGNGQSAVSYQLPAGLYQYIQSVVAVVDTSGSGAVTPLLTVYDDAGIVVADKQQGQSIDAGGAGRATWALRLTDENAGGGGGGFTPQLEQLEDTTDIDGTVVAAGASALAPWSHLSGVALLDLTTPTIPTVLVEGDYIFDVGFSAVPASTLVTDNAPMGSTLNFGDGIVPVGTLQQFRFHNTGAGFNACTFGITRHLAPGDVFEFTYVNGDGTAGREAAFKMGATVTRVH